jgi:hypothetical protein
LTCGGQFNNRGIAEGSDAMYSRWFVILLFLPVFAGQSQPPSPAPPKVGQVDQQKNHANQGQIRSDDGISQAPPIVINNQFSAPPSNRPEESSNENTQDKSSPKGISDALLAVFTLLLVVVAVLQWITMRGHAHELGAIAGHIRTALTETTKAATAARDSADTAQRIYIASHRPKLAIRFVTLINEIAEAGDMEMSGRFHVFNVGDSAAKIRASYSEVIFGDSLPPRSTSYTASMGEPFEEIVLLSGQFHAINFPTGESRGLEPDERAAIRRRLADAKTNPVTATNWPWYNLFFVGWIEYVDESGRMRKTGFCRKYDFLTKRFAVENDYDYQYED